MNWEPGINHVEFWIRSEAVSLPFYRRLFAILGWKEIGGRAFSSGRTEIIRGPVRMDSYSRDFYTVDFRDPDGYVLEVAHTPHMKL